MEAAHDRVAVLVLLARGRAEQGLGLGLRGRCEREEGDVRRHEVARLHLGEIGVHDRPVIARVVVEIEHPLELQLVRRCVEGGLEGRRRAAFLGAVRLVDDHREAGTRELGQGRDVRPRVEKCLDGDHDNLPLLAKGLDELGALGAVRDGVAPLVAADHDDLARHLGELGDGLLYVLVERQPVGDHHDAREYLLAVSAAEPREVVRGPGDGLGLAGAGRVLDEVAAPRPVLARVGQDLPLRVELVVAREDLGRRLAPAARRILPVLDLLEYEAVEDGQPVVALKDGIPEVVGPVLALGRVRVASAAVAPQVERKEAGLRRLAREGAEVRTHPHLVLGDGEVDHGAPLVHEQRVLPAAVGFYRPALVGVLVDRVTHGLGELGLDLAGGDRDAVDEQGEVERLASGGLVVDLVHEAQDVGVVALPRPGHAFVVWVSRHALDGLVPRHLEALAQREDGAVPLETLHQGAPQLVGPAGALLAAHLVELLGRCGFEPGDEVVEDQRVVRVEARVVGREFPALVAEACDLAGDVALEGVLLVDLAAAAVLDGGLGPTCVTHVNSCHGYASVQSILPVTAWWMMDFRYSPSFSMSFSWRETASSMAAQRSSR